MWHSATRRETHRQRSAAAAAAYPAVDLAHLGKDAIERVVQPSLPSRLSRAHQQRVDLVDGAEDRPVRAASVRLLRIPVALIPRGQQVLSVEN